MYPLKIVTVNCGEPILTQIRDMLAKCQALIDTNFTTVEQAIERWTSNDSDPHLALFHLRGLADVDQMQRLKRAFNWPVVALVDTGRDQLATLMALANRAGATQVVPLPLDTEDFSAALDAVGLEYGYRCANAKIIAVSGVSGGCGATTLAINLASEIAHLFKRRTILVELSLQKGVLATYLNVEPKYTLPDLLNTKVKVDLSVMQQALVNVTENFDIVSGAHFEIAPVEASHLDLLRLLDHVRRLAEVVVLDVPCTNDEAFVQTLSIASHVVLVAQQSLPSLKSLRLTLELLARLNLRSDTRGEMPLEVVLNRYDSGAAGFDLEHLKERMKVSGMCKVANDYASVNAALNNGVPLRAEVPRSRALADIGRLATKVMDPAETPVNGATYSKPSSWLRRLTSILAGANS
jgi:pilus assembly protein CpaE